MDQKEEDITSPALKAAAEVADDSLDPLCITAKIITRTTQSDAELAKEQATGVGPDSVIYKALRDHVEVTTEQLEQGSFELRKVHRMLDSLRINTDGVFKARLVLQKKPRWCAICPPSFRGSVVWKTHALAHSGVTKTTSRLQLTWYWAGMTTMTRKAVRSCEVCQAAKHGGTEGPQGRQRLHAGRPRQKVAVDLVGPMPKMSRGNRWILVLVDHFTQARCLGHPRRHSTGGRGSLRRESALLHWAARTDPHGPGSSV